MYEGPACASSAVILRVCPHQGYCHACVLTVLIYCSQHIVFVDLTCPNNQLPLLIISLYTFFSKSPTNKKVYWTSFTFLRSILILLWKIKRIVEIMKNSQLFDPFVGPVFCQRYNYHILLNFLYVGNILIWLCTPLLPLRNITLKLSNYK